MQARDSTTIWSTTLSSKGLPPPTVRREGVPDRSVRCRVAGVRSRCSSDTRRLAMVFWQTARWSEAGKRDGTVAEASRGSHGPSWTLLSAGLPVPARGARSAGPAGGRHPVCRGRPVRQPGRPPGRARAGRRRTRWASEDRVQRRLPLAGCRPRGLPGDQPDGPGPPRHQGQRRGRARRRGVRRGRGVWLCLSGLRRR
jgi:hypothetical protein